MNAYYVWTQGQECLRRLNHLKNYSSKKSYFYSLCTIFYAIEQFQEVVIYAVKIKMLRCSDRPVESLSERQYSQITYI